ncbi:MAG: glycosyltransferase [Hyphomicrobiaceae bacterium]
MPSAIVTGHMTPYNRRLFEAFVDLTGEELYVYSCIENEPHRSWVVGEPRNFKLTILPGFRKHLSDISHVYFNPSIVRHLAKLRPDLIAVAGFSPTMALAGAYAKVTRTPFGISTDGVPSIDPGERSWPHRLMRRLLVPSAKFGICASEDSVKLLARWGLDPARSTVVPLVPPWDPPAIIPSFGQRRFDILFAGGLNEEIKGALFFADVMAALKQARPDLMVRVTGDGPARAEMQARLAAANIHAHFDGALQPGDMSAVFASAKVMLFPSRGDVWGLVANEAVQCGTPVLGSPHATSCTGYIERFGLGLVRPLETKAWADAAFDMLTHESRWTSFMARRQEAIAWASIETSARGMKRAFDIGRGRPGHTESLTSVRA